MKSVYLFSLNNRGQKFAFPICFQIWRLISTYKHSSFFFMFVPIEQMKLEVRILVLNYLIHKNWDHGKTLLQLRHIVPSWSASCLVCGWKKSTLYIFSSSKIYYKLFSWYFYNTEQNCKKDFKPRKLKNIVNNTKNSTLMGTVYAIYFCNFVQNKWITLNWILNKIVLWLGS